MTSERIGALDHRLTIEAPSRTSDGGGGAAIIWTLVDEVWGAMRPISASESLDAEGLKGRVSHEIVIRFRPGVSPKMRFRLAARLFDIRSAVDAEEEHRFLRCLVEERLT